MTSPFGGHDVAETSSDSDAGLVILQRELARLATLENSGASEIPALMGSSMQIDDAAIEYTPLSYQLRFLAASAHDHMSTLGRLLTGVDGGLPALAGYTLIRSAVEASAYGIWLLNGGTRNKRVLRSLRLIYHNRRDVESLANRLGSSNQAKNESVFKRLNALKDRVPALRQNSLDQFPTTTSILEETDQVVCPGPLTGLQVWKSCSGIAHANDSAAVGMLERRQISAGDGVGASYFTTSSFAVVGSMFQVAMDYYDTMLGMAGRHGTTSPSGKSLG